MNLSLKTIGKVSLQCVNILWKLGLGAIGIAAIFFIVFLLKEIHRSELSGGKQISDYVTEYEKDGYVSLYNQRDKEFTLERLDWVSHGLEDSDIAVYSKNLKRGFFDYNTGKSLTDPIYDKAWNFYEGVGAVEKDGYVSFLNTDFQPAFPQKFKLVRASDSWPEAIRFRSGQCVLALTPDSIGVIDKHGNWILEPKYQLVSDLSTDSCRVVRINGLAGVVDYKGNVIIEPIYDAVRLPNKGVANVVKDGSQKQITYSGTVLRDFVFDNVRDFVDPSSDEFTLYEINDKYGVMRSRTCEVVIPALYDDIKYLSGNRFMAMLPATDDISSTPESGSSSWIVLDDHNNILSGKK